MMPAPTASTADSSDHQKPGICRAQNVNARPAAPEIRNIQPRKIVTARLAIGGTIMAASPRIVSRMASIKKAFPCSGTAAFISDCNLATSWGRVIEISRCGGRNPREYSVAQRGEAKFVHRQELNEIKDNS